MSRKYVGIACLVGVVCFTGAYLFAGEQTKERSPKFKAYLGIYTKSEPKVQLILKNAQLRNLGGSTFLVGMPVEYRRAPAIDEKSEKLRGDELIPDRLVTRWVAISDVATFYEFDDEKGYRDFFPSYDRY